MTMNAEDAKALMTAHRLVHAGAPLDSARRVVVCLHGRGASAADILGIAGAIGLVDVAYLAPQADDGAWYPRPFMEPLSANAPYLDAALDRIAAILADLAIKGFGGEQVVIAGFSQGACLSLEFAARQPGRVGGVLGFSGGLIGPSVEGRDETARLDGLPVFIGCSERDPFIPAPRVRETVAHYERRGARVISVLYPEPGHTINMDEIGKARALLEGLDA
ncbi:dienelactone hydrolase family protein [Aurantimonas sp. A2-1-M11]|uniref:alpha/beta hydrolase n=1 Tax=Aurantimonas sp. A2-1-M11 TaxID=3113712 RepID=UPI002F95B906